MNWEEELDKAAKLIDNATAVLIIAGMCLSKLNSSIYSQQGRVLALTLGCLITEVLMVGQVLSYFILNFLFRILESISSFGKVRA